MIRKEAVEGENGLASAWGNTQASELAEGTESWFSIPARTGATGAGAEREEEDPVTQQSVWPQSQHLQVAFAGVPAGGQVVATTCAHTSDRLNKMASVFLTVEP